MPDGNRKNLLVYFHGMGSTKDENYEFQTALANELNAYLLSPESTLPSKRATGGYAWYPMSISGGVRRHYLNLDPASSKARRPFKSIVVLEPKDMKICFTFQMGQASQEILKELANRKLKYTDVIFSGRGQGAFAAMFQALSLKYYYPQPAKAVIPINGYYRNSLVTGGTSTKIFEKDCPVLWIAGDRDDVLPAKDKASYTILQQSGVKKLEFAVMPGSTHDILPVSGASFVAEKLRAMGISM